MQKYFSLVFLLGFGLVGCGGGGGGESFSFNEGTYSGESEYIDVSDSALSASCDEFVEDLEALGLTTFRISLFGGGVGEIHRLVGSTVDGAQDAGLLTTYDAENEQNTVTAEERISFAFDPQSPGTTGCIGTRTNTISAISDEKLEVTATIDAGCRSGRASFQCKYEEAGILEKRS